MSEKVGRKTISARCFSGFQVFNGFINLCSSYGLVHFCGHWVLWEFLKRKRVVEISSIQQSFDVLRQAFKNVMFGFQELLSIGRLQGVNEACGGLYTFLRAPKKLFACPSSVYLWIS